MDGRHDRSSGLLAAPSDAGTPLAHASASPALESTTGGAASPDALSDVLRTVRLTGALFFLTEAASPWTIEIPDGATLAPVILPRAQHVISYHVVTRGSCWGGLRDGAAVRLEAGDVLVLPHGDAYAMSTAPDKRMQVAARLLAEGAAKVSAVALEVGYDSEAAFSRAFRRVAGVPPAAWRARCAARPPAPR